MPATVVVEQERTWDTRVNRVRSLLLERTDNGTTTTHIDRVEVEEIGDGLRLTTSTP